MGYDGGTVTMPPPTCNSPAGADNDGDGFPAGVDCNDCEPSINPGAFDIPGNGIDEDCDGHDAVATNCDDGLPIAPTAAQQAARAMGLCKFIDESDPGWV